MQRHRPGQVPLPYYDSKQPIHCNEVDDELVNASILEILGLGRTGEHSTAFGTRQQGGGGATEAQ